MSESDHYNKTISEIKAQHEDKLRKQSELDGIVRSLNNKLMKYRDKEIIDQAEINRLHQVISEIETKNKKLNEKLNDLMFSKAQAYK